MERYSIEKVIGEGSFGRAMLVQCKITHIQNVVKEIQLPKVYKNIVNEIYFGFNVPCQLSCFTLDLNSHCYVRKMGVSCTVLIILIVAWYAHGSWLFYFLYLVFMFVFAFLQNQAKLENSRGEAILLSKMKHPNIVAFREAFEGSIFI